MKMVKNLSKVIVRNYEGFNLREDLNFSDDGNYFRGFDYKGLPITTLRSNNETYLSVRVDYLDNEFTQREWMNTHEFYLAEEFNGVYEFDLDKLIDNCEKILAKIDELNEKANKEVVDIDAIKAQFDKEVKRAKTVIDFVKSELKWWNLSDYELKATKRYMTLTIEHIERIEGYALDSFDKRRLKEMQERINECGYIEIREDDFYLREMYNYCDKSNNL